MARLRLLLLLLHNTTRVEHLVTIIKHRDMLVNLLTDKIIFMLRFLTNNFGQRRHTNITRPSRSRIINPSNADSHHIHRHRHTRSRRSLKHRHHTHNLITARTALLPSYLSTRLPRQVAASP